MSARRRVAYPAIALAAALPRLAVLLWERGDVTAAFTEKSDEFARTFVESGTYGFIPGEPSAYTQPLYGFFLIPLYSIFGRSWGTIGAAQIVVAVAVALLVYEIGRRAVSARVGGLGAVLATLSPYLVWHDVHVNREILDQLLAAAVVLLTLVAAERGSPLAAAGLGLALGLAILGNARLALLPLVVAGYLVWRLGARRRVLAAAAVVLACAAVAVAPWVVRNAVVVGCPALTTDSRALWKANNEQTYDVLASGRWIDEVEGPPGAPPTPEMAWGTYEAHGTVVHVDECAQLRLYQDLVWDFWVDHPGEKGRLAVQAAGMLWSPRATQAEGRPEAATAIDAVRKWAMPAYLIPLYALALGGAFVLPRRLAVLAALLLAYSTATAVVFAGATRYRVAWDFLLALLAAAALVRLAAREREPVQYARWEA